MNQLSSTQILALIAAYFVLLIIISLVTGRKSSNDDFFVAGRKSPWFLVAFGMIGATLSGVTLISIPGVVGATPELLEQYGFEGNVKKNINFSYMQLVFGYLLGYAVIALVLLPLYYRLNVTSIYSYLEQRLGKSAYKTGAGFFLLSRIVGAAFRLYLVAIVLQKFVMDDFGVPFALTVAVTILLIWIYTFQGGIKTIVWTDTLQTTFMLLAVILTIIGIGKAMNTSEVGLIEMVQQSDYSRIFYFDGLLSNPNNFFKQFLGGALITIAMTGLDQDMMQKNLSCRSLGDAQKNMFTFSGILIFANLLFLSLGALLYIYAAQNNVDIPIETLADGKRVLKTDQLFPTIALQELSPLVGGIFIIGLIAAAYSSADSALTALTTSFCIDFLNFEKDNRSEAAKKRTRLIVHLGFSVLLLVVIVIFNAISDDSVINQLFTFTGYTYGPLLGLFVFGMFTKLEVKNQLVLPVCLIAPVLSYFLNQLLVSNGVDIGFLIFGLNGLLAFLGLLAVAKRG